MERLTRLIGIGLLVGALGYSISHYQEAVSAMTPVDEEEALVLPIELEQQQAEIADGDPAAPPPRYLGFVDGYQSGRYTIEYAPLNEDPDEEPADDPTDDVPPVVASSEVTPGTMAPGLYATAFGVERCSYQIRRMASSRSKVEKLIGEDFLSEGRVLVSFNEIEPDVFTARPQCGEWMPWSPLVEPLTVAGNGDYWVGDLAQGIWDVPASCMWEKVVGFRGAELVDVQASGIGPEPLVVDEDTLGVRIRRCAAELKWSAEESEND
ncbi:MAG: hypothetical protein ACRBK7_31365 [Acidimicrobiales bacterium]